MSPFNPYIPSITNITTSFTHYNTTITVQAAQATPTANIAEQNAAGASLATADVIGIITGVLILFIGLAWFVYHALAVLPRRKNMLVMEKKGQRGGAV
jgi:hypothetical protein